MERLDKVLSILGVCSRKDAKSIIKRGEVTINGSLAKNCDENVLENSIIIASGKTYKYNKFVFLIMNKPAGVVCAVSDNKDQTVIDIIPKELYNRELFPVGRLDKDTEGLLLLTNDGDFSHRVISPKKNIIKCYEAVLARETDDNDITAFLQGLILCDGTQCLPAKLEKIDKNTVKVYICEGKYHQVKRMFGATDNKVITLKRISIGALTLGNLITGETRVLTEDEINMIFE